MRLPRRRGGSFPRSCAKRRRWFLAGEGWHPGVIGIVASRLVERHHRPAVVISLDGEGGGRGSGRSIPGFDLLAGLEACSSTWMGFGGHRAAAGWQLKAENVEAFRAAFAAHAASVLEPDDLKRTERVDAMVGGAGLGLELAEELQQLTPFGMGNPGVRLLVPSARVRDVRHDGGGQARPLQPPQRRPPGAGGRLWPLEAGGGEDDPVDAAVRLEVNRWNGSVEPRVVLRELYPPRGARGTRPRAQEQWWQRFEAELAGGPRRLAAHGPQQWTNLCDTLRPVGREEVRPRSSPAARGAGAGFVRVGEVLALVADRDRRVALARRWRGACRRRRARGRPRPRFPLRARRARRPAHLRPPRGFWQRGPRPARRLRPTSAPGEAEHRFALAHAR